MSPRPAAHPAPDQRHDGRRLERGLAVALTALVVVFHLGFLTHAGGLWRDEVNTVELAGAPSLHELAGSLRYDGFPILSTLLVRAWLAAPWSAGDPGMRMLGFMVGLLVLGAMWVAASMLRCRAPLFSLGLVGLNAVALQATDSIRPYGLGIALFFVTLGLLWRVLESPGAGRVALAVVAAILGVQCMYQNAFLLAGVGGAALAVALRGRNARAAIAIGIVCAAAAASLLPYVPAIRAARDWNIVSQAPTSAGQLLTMLATAGGGGSPGRAWVWLGPILLCSAVAFDARRLGSRSDRFLFAGAAFIASTAVFLLALGSTRLPTQAWYYIPLIGVLALLLDAVAWSGPPPAARRRLALVLGVVALISAVIALPGWRRVLERRTNVDLVAAELGARAGAGDLILVYPWYNGVSFRRYYRGAAHWGTIPPLEDVRIHRYDLLKRAMAGPDPMGPVLDAAARSLQSGGRVWLVGWLPAPGVDPLPAPLPPAPLGPGGWNNGPYVNRWGLELTYFLESHGLRGEGVPVPSAAPVDPLENLPLGVVTGWR